MLKHIHSTDGTGTLSSIVADGQSNLAACIDPNFAKNGKRIFTSSVGSMKEILQSLAAGEMDGFTQYEMELGKFVPVLRNPHS